MGWGKVRGDSGGGRGEMMASNAVWYALRLGVEKGRWEGECGEVLGE